LIFLSKRKKKPDQDVSPLFNTAVSLTVQTELCARYANLFMLCYLKKDITGMHIALTAFTHTLHALQLWGHKQRLMLEMKAFVMAGGFPISEHKALDWLLHHYFEQVNDTDESVLLNWYQSIDDEWVLRKKLHKLFPDMSSSELSTYIVTEQQRLTS